MTAIREHAIPGVGSGKNPDARAPVANNVKSFSDTPGGGFLRFVLILCAISAGSFTCDMPSVSYRGLDDQRPPMMETLDLHNAATAGCLKRPHRNRKAFEQIPNLRLISVRLSLRGRVDQ